LAAGNGIPEPQRQPGASWPAPSGYYYRRKKLVPSVETVEEAVEEAVELAASEDYTINPKQLQRMTNAAVSRAVTRGNPDTSYSEALADLKAAIEREAARKDIERAAAALAAALAYAKAKQEEEDDESFLLMAA
jgi:hypothetical protein